MMPVLLGGKLRVLVFVGGKYVVHNMCGGNSVSPGRANTNGDHEYASGSEPGLSASGVLSPSRGGYYTCSPCDIRFTGRKWRSNFAIHTNMFVYGNGFSIMPTVANLVTLRPPRRPYHPYVPRALTLCLIPPELALCLLHAPTVWPLRLPFSNGLLTVLVAPVRRTLDIAPSKQLSPLLPCLAWTMLALTLH
jgi:hypothetical protein